MSGWSDFPWIRLSHPAYLLLLLFIPAVYWLSRRSLAGLGRFRFVTANLLRAAVVSLLVLLLTDPEAVRRTDHQTTVFVVDQSHSVSPRQQGEAFGFVAEAAKAIRPGKDQLAVVTFARAASIEQLPRSALVIPALAEPSQPDATDLGAAIRLASAIFPASTARRVVLLSDGNENVGSSERDVESLVANDVPLDVVPLAYEREQEISVERLSAPATARLNDTMDLHLVLRSLRPATGRIEFYQNDEPIDLDPASDAIGYRVRLKAGPNRVSLPIAFHASGLHRFRAVFVPDRPESDTVLLNNEAVACTLVGGRHTALLVTGTLPGEPAEDRTVELFTSALRLEGIDCEVIDVNDLVPHASALLDRSMVILSNISAPELSRAGQEALAAYVRDLGGGLVAVGGDKSFSAGGYEGTPLEDVLPVRTDKDKLQHMASALVLVIDRSGSMAGEKIELAKQAAIGSVELLTPQDWIGIVAFDHLATWELPLQLARDRAAAVARIRQIGIGGGTSLYPGLDLAEQALRTVDANPRHVVALTDGQSQPADFAGLAKRMAQQGMTLSTIAIGPDADHTLLRGLAQIGNGRAYATSSPQFIPRMVGRETVYVTRRGIVEKPFFPTLRPRPADEPTAGLVQDELPPLHGYVMTVTKPEATAAMVRQYEGKEDPILAYWQVGLGRTVAFTSGLWSRWGADWVAWPGFAKLWAQVARWASRPASQHGWDVSSLVENGRVTLVVEADEARRASGGPASFKGQVLDPHGARAPLSLRRTGMGRFETDFPAASAGTYLVQLEYQSGGVQPAGIIRAAVGVSYSAEYRELRSNEARLREIASRTGGRVLELASAASVFDPATVRPAMRRRPIRQDVLKWVVLLFLLDVAARRLAFEPARAWAAVRHWMGARLVPVATPRPAAPMSALKAARARVRESTRSQIATDAAPTDTVAAQPSLPTEGRREAGPAPPREQTIIELQESSKDTEGADSLARLLRAKRRLRGPNKDG